MRHGRPVVTTMQIVKKVEVESQRTGRKRRNLLADLRREVAIMRELRHKNIVTLQARSPRNPFGLIMPASVRRGTPGMTRIAAGWHAFTRSSHAPCQDPLPTDPGSMCLCPKPSQVHSTMSGSLQDGCT